MKYLLVTAEKYPKFYRLDGEIISVDLNYANKKTFSSIDDEGELIHLEVSAEQATSKVGSTCYWMVDSIELSLLQLGKQWVFPFDNKKGAVLHAKRLGLVGHRYLAIN